MYRNALRLNKGNGTGYATYESQEEEMCFSNTDNCQTGFTLMVWLKMTDLYDNGIHHYISSGKPGNFETGVSIFSVKGMLTAHVRTQQRSWEQLTVPFPLFECKSFYCVTLIVSLSL